ncbi:MAG: pantetheine-phosphate adenylyltransferase [Chlamydiae bacterium CG10_big_fil_rev_8_21_14_0_10_42_34]|nr:MAG: pantetheine-phosphate adenylyltransferase [Chlamydiae bacterium CG10_big_fil_rev_8_21_14_0_10_42_34]
MRKIGLIAGTFDPPTLGHVNIIQRASSLTDQLIIAVIRNPEKKTHFSIDERFEMLNILLPAAEITPFDGLLTDFARKKKVTFLIRGLRNFIDFEHEYQMATANKKLSGIETLFLMADEKYAQISSTLIKEIARVGGSLQNFIPQKIEPFIRKKLEKL